MTSPLFAPSSNAPRVQHGSHMLDLLDTCCPDLSCPSRAPVITSLRLHVSGSAKLQLLSTSPFSASSPTFSSVGLSGFLPRYYISITNVSRYRFHCIHCYNLICPIVSSQKFNPSFGSRLSSGRRESSDILLSYLLE